MDVVTLTQELMRIPSITPDGGECIGYVETHLQNLGFICTRLDKEGTANVYAILKKGDGPHLAFAGHTDVVPPGDLTTWTHPPFTPTISGDVLCGRGAIDMKGAIGAFLVALEKFVKTNFKGTISLLITGDEEGPATYGTPYILEHMTDVPDLCIIGEPSSNKTAGDQIKIGRRGSMTGTLFIQGKQGHIAYPHLAQNPIPILMHLLNDLYGDSLDEGSDFFDPSHFEVISIDVGNTASNVIPGSITASFGIRYNTAHTPESLKNWLVGHIEKHTSTYDLKTRAHGPAFYNDDKRSIHIISKAIEDVTGSQPTLSTSGGTSDGRFISSICPVIECGLSNATIHKVDECVDIQDLHTMVQIYESILRNFFD